MYLGSISFLPAEHTLLIFCYRNNIAMAIESYLNDCSTRWATKLFLTESCAELIASGASCSIKYAKL